MNPKIAIAVIVAVVLLFVAAVASSGRRGEGELPRPGVSEGDEEDGFPAGLSRRLGSTAAVERGEMRIGCSADADDSDLLRFSGSCSIEVDGADERLRLLRMTAVTSVVVVAPAPDVDEGGDDYEIEAEFEPGKAITLAVGSDRTTVKLECGLGDECLVRLLDD